jgi:hypothetical protein
MTKGFAKNLSEVLETRGLTQGSSRSRLASHSLTYPV